MLKRFDAKPDAQELKPEITVINENSALDTVRDTVIAAGKAGMYVISDSDILLWNSNNL